MHSLKAFLLLYFQLVFIPVLSACNTWSIYSSNQKAWNPQTSFKNPPTKIEMYKLFIKKKKKMHVTIYNLGVETCCQVANVNRFPIAASLKTTLEICRCMLTMEPVDASSSLRVFCTVPYICKIVKLSQKYMKPLTSGRSAAVALNCQTVSGLVSEYDSARRWFTSRGLTAKWTLMSAPCEPLTPPMPRSPTWLHERTAWVKLSD